MNNWAFNEHGTITQVEMENNALIIKDFFIMRGWSMNAVAALLANMEPESGINPARWENDAIGNLNGGLGLVQWTPATKLIMWVTEEFENGNLENNNYLDGDNQIARIQYELLNNIQYSSTPIFKESFQEWTVSNKKPGYLAAAFMLNYERPSNQGWGVQIARAKAARKWYTFLTGDDLGGWLPPGFIAAIKKSVDKQRGVL